MWPLRKRHSAITFDLGTAGIRACQVRPGRDRARLADTLLLERQAPGTDKPQDKDPGPRVDAGQLDRLVGQAAFAGRAVGLVLSSPAVRYLPIHLPSAALSQPAQRIEQALRLEVAQESRKSPDDLEVRFWPLRGERGKEPNVMAVVLPTRTAAGWCQALDTHGLELARIDVAPCALARAVQQLWTPGESDLWGLLDLGQRHATLTVVAERTPAYVRTLSMAPHDWSRQLADVFEVPLAVAEHLKRTHGAGAADAASAPPTEPSVLYQPDVAHTVQRVLSEALRMLAQEITRCFTYMMQSFPDHTVRRLWIAGGGAALPGLTTALEAELDLPVLLLATPARGASVEAGPADALTLTPFTAAAVGGALLDLEAA